MSEKHPPARLTMWVIYDHPADYPRAYIARRWVGDDPTDDIIVAVGLAQLREAMRRRHLSCLPRHDSDDEAIVESWL